MLKRILLAFLLSCLLVQPIQAQDGSKLYLPLVTKSSRCELMTDPILRITDGTTIIDLLSPGSGWELADPYWQPQIAQFKGGGAYVDSGLAEGKQLVHKEYDNVIETIPLSVTGIDQGAAIQTIRDLLQLGRQASDYWAESYEYDDVWLEAKPACANSLIGYSRIIKMSIPELKNPFGQPFFSAYAQPVMEDFTLIIEREPFWRGTPPGEIVGPLYNLIKNPDFELWNFGTGDSQPDSWTDIETLWIIGQNSQDDIPKWGDYDLKVRVSGSTKAGAAKGVGQILANTEPRQYTIIAWVRSDGISNGVGRILVEYGNQLELYRDSTQHGWTLYADTFTVGVNQTVRINCEILTTAANTDGTIYFDGLMVIPGDWVQEAENGQLPYLSSSHIKNHYSILTAGNINYVDVWNIPGDVDALTRVEVDNVTYSTTPAEFYYNVKIGQRRLGNVKQFTHIFDPAGIFNNTSSNNDYVNIPVVNSSWIEVASREFADKISSMAEQGRLRVFARVYDNRVNYNLAVRIGYYLGSGRIRIKYPDSATVHGSTIWEMVNLTLNQAVIFDLKHVNDPTALGFRVDFSRPSGIDAARLDYVLIMPTDGGYIEANIDPPLGYLHGLVVDNTNSLNISRSFRRGAGWKLLKTSAANDYYFYLKTFKNKLYVATLNGLLSFDDVNFTTITGPTSSVVLEEYQSNLYSGSSFDSNLWSSFDGNTWSNIANIAPDVIFSMVTFNGYLYLGCNRGRIHRWDGAIMTTSLDDGSGSMDYHAMAVYKNKLYAGGDNFAGRPMYVYDPVTNAWTLFGNFAQKDFYAMKVFKDKLYIAGYDEAVMLGKIWTYDGNPSNTLSTAYIDNTAIRSFLSLEIYNDKLYVSSQIGDTSHGRDVLVSEDGLTWTPIFGEETAAGYDLEVYNGQLFMVDITEVGGDIYSRIFSYTDEDLYALNTIADYQGGPFTSPPKKLHRWIISYDRAGYINNINDSALVGFGYVPRYLSLINYYPQ